MTGERRDAYTARPEDRHTLKMATARKTKTRKASAKPVGTPLAGRRAAEATGLGPFTAEERATLALFSVEGIGPATLCALRKAFGSLAEAVRQPADRVAEHLRDQATRARYRAIKDVHSLADRLFERADKLGARVLFASGPGWPAQLAGLSFPPVLYVVGAIEASARRVAIVGSRETDEYGAQLATFFAGALAARGVGVVSGGALGVDCAAHRACLGNAGATVAVLGSGVDVPYPSEHRGLFREIAAQGGAVVSHFPPGTPAVPQNFKVRNKLIAALCDAVVVVRASADSGALGTAASAFELKRPVFAVPGDVTCPLAAGVNGLLESGRARACTGLAPVAAAMGLDDRDWPSASASSSRGAPTARSRAPAPRLDERGLRAEVPGDLRPVWEALGSDPVQFDELARRCRLEPAQLAGALVRLELLGLCQERLGKVFVRA